MNPRVKRIIETNGYTIAIQFTNNEIKNYDCRCLLEFGVFKELRDKKYFNKVKVSLGTIVWPNGQDVCPDTLYMDSKATTPNKAIHGTALRIKT